MIKLSFMLASFTALLSWLCYREAAAEYAYIHQGGGEMSHVNLLEGSFKCLGITSDEGESLSILIARAGPAQAQPLTWDGSRGSLVVPQ